MSIMINGIAALDGAGISRGDLIFQLCLMMDRLRAMEAADAIQTHRL